MMVLVVIAWVEVAIVLVVVLVVVQYIGKVGKVVGKPSFQVCLEKNRLYNTYKLQAL